MTGTHESVACNLCGERDGDVVADDVRAVRTPAGDFSFRVRLVCCKRCGLVYWTPRLRPEILAEYYEAVFRAPVMPVAVGDERREMIRRRIDWLQRVITHGALLEIGAGEGFFLQRAVEAGFTATGLEPSASYAAVARQVAPDAGVHQTFIDQHDAPGSADVVCAFFVLEHSLDAFDFLRRCHRYLKPGGWCFLEVPDVARYATQTGDMLWHEHTYHFSPQTLTRLLRRAGFCVERFESPGPSYPFGMAILAQRMTAEITGWDHDLPDDAARQVALNGFRAHAALIESYHDALRRCVGPLVERVRANGTRLAVYGSGVFFDQLFQHTTLEPSDIALVVDDNPDKWGTQTRQGLLIAPPDRLKEHAIEIVLVGSDTFETPVAQRARAVLGERNPVTIVRAHSDALARLTAAGAL